MKSKIKIFFSFLAIAAVLLISGCGCKQSSPHQYNMKLEIWGFLDDEEALMPIFEAYRKIDPNIVGFEYKKLSTDTYKKELIDALASGQGPDIFLVHNTWLPSFADKIVPAPKDVLTEQKFRQDFVDVAANDFISSGSIYAVPLSVDSLGLYYNKDLFNEAGIATPPRDWNQFVDDVRRLTKINSYGEIVQSGAAIGTAYNINRPTDILNLLMLQSGTPMVEGNAAVFNVTRSDGQDEISAGENALNFYTQFARLSSPNYTWNSRMHYSIDAFAEGNVAMMFNYSWHIKTVQNKSPKLNFGVAQIPQFAGSQRINYANYWAYGVAKNKVIDSKAPTSESSGTMRAATNDERVREAWKFLAFLTTRPEAAISINSTIGGGSTTSGNFDPAAIYLSRTQMPSARRDIIEAQKSDPNLGVFATDNLIARSWRQKDPESFEAIFSEMIDQVNRGQISIYDALDSASSRMNAIMNQ